MKYEGLPFSVLVLTAVVVNCIWAYHTGGTKRLVLEAEIWGAVIIIVIPLSVIFRKMWRR